MASWGFIKTECKSSMPLTQGQVIPRVRHIWAKVNNFFFLSRVWAQEESLLISSGGTTTGKLLMFPCSVRLCLLSLVSHRIGKVFIQVADVNYFFFFCILVLLWCSNFLITNRYYSKGNSEQGPLHFSSPRTSSCMIGQAGSTSLGSNAEHRE